MVIHRNLEDLADNPNVAAALLIADGDRLPLDTTLNMGSTAAVPGRRQGRRAGAFVPGLRAHLEAPRDDGRAHDQRL